MMEVKVIRYSEAFKRHVVGELESGRLIVHDKNCRTIVLSHCSLLPAESLSSASGLKRAYASSVWRTLAAMFSGSKGF